MVSIKVSETVSERIFMPAFLREIKTSLILERKTTENLLTEISIFVPKISKFVYLVETHEI